MNASTLHQPRSGFFGKLPSAGDFVRRRLSDDVVRHWDAHVSTLLCASQIQPRDWDTAIGAGCAWAFLAAPGCCGDLAWAGAVAPSHDRVGRRFPMLLAYPLVHADDAADLLDPRIAWFEAAVAALQALLSGQLVGLDAFDARVDALPQPRDDDATRTRRRGPGADHDDSRVAVWRQCLESGASLWWRPGLGIPCMVAGLPDAAACAHALRRAAAMEARR